MSLQSNEPTTYYITRQVHPRPFLLFVVKITTGGVEKIGKYAQPAMWPTMGEWQAFQDSRVAARQAYHLSLAWLAYLRHITSSRSVSPPVLLSCRPGSYLIPERCSVDEAIAWVGRELGHTCGQQGSMAEEGVLAR